MMWLIVWCNVQYKMMWLIVCFNVQYKMMWLIVCCNVHYAFLGAVAKLLKTAVSFVMFVRPSVCLHGITRRIFTKLDI